MQETPLTPAAVLAGLRTVRLPRTVRCHGQVGSTMDVARELLRVLPEVELPLLVSAEEQTAGRGRLGRSWVAPAGSALLLSLAMRPRWLAPTRATALVWVAGLALCEAVEQVAGVTAALKWPNDLLLPLREAGGERPDTWAKAAGILLELSHGAAGVEAAILGCGVNVRAAPPAGSTRYPATAVDDAAGRPVSRLELLRALLERLDGWYGRLEGGDDAALHRAWRARLHTLGRQVAVETPSGTLAGTAEDVTTEGALLVRDRAGALHAVSVGDVGLP